MSGDAFFDTNLIVYAFGENGLKTQRAEGLMKAGGFISTQVLNEFTDIARRKLRMTWPETRRALQAIRSTCSTPVPLTTTIHEAGIAIAERYHYRIYDALIIAAAVHAGCRTLYSEDLANGQTIQGVRITNPFA